MSESSKDEQVCWYFSFGPNMSQSFLAKDAIRMGRVSPTISIPGSLKGWELSFTMMGYEGCEPRFANLAESRGSEGQHGSSMPVHGIAHRLSLHELSLLDLHEGAGHAFKRIEVTFQPYGSASIPAQPIAVWAYVCTLTKLATPGLPSRRYLDLLVQSATKSQLATEYIKWLERRDAFEFDGAKMPHPSLEEQKRVISRAELTAKSYREPENGKSDSLGPAWVALGGQIFDLNAHAVARAPAASEPMLRNLARRQDGTAFVLAVLARAYEDEVPPTNAGLCQIDLAALSRRQHAYIATWATFLVLNACPRIGVLEDSGFEKLLSGDQSPKSVTCSITQGMQQSVMIQ